MKIPLQQRILRCPYSMYYGKQNITVKLKIRYMKKKVHFERAFHFSGWSCRAMQRANQEQKAKN